MCTRLVYVPLALLATIVLFLRAFSRGLFLFCSLWFGILGCWNVCVLAGFSKIDSAISHVYLFCSLVLGCAWTLVVVVVIG